MKSIKRNFAFSMMTLAVQGALASMAIAPLAAFADDDDIAELTRPSNYVEAGVANVSNSSNKFGEYNGMNKKGAYFIGNAGIRGGDSYGMGDGTMRWSINGQDLGTTSRSLDASVASQGEWNLGIGVDQLRHYTTTNYTTPFIGSMGGNTFILPPSFGVINSAANGVNLVGARNLTPAQLGAFDEKDVYTERTNTSFKAGYDYDKHWNFRFDYNHLDQSGAKLISSGTDSPFPATPANAAATFGGIANSKWTKEAPIILMNPTNYTTETFNAAVSWTGDKGHGSIGYFGSLFRDAYSGVTWSNPFVSVAGLNATGTPLAGGVGFPTSTMSTPPSNQFHQLNLNGGYAFSPATRMAGNFSYARNTQDASFDGTYTPGFVLSPIGGSLNGKVAMIHADARLTNQTTKDLQLSTGFKYNERDNTTSSQLYQFYDESNTLRNIWSAPMSNRKTQFDVAGDYRITSAQKLHLGYEYEKIERWCNNSPSLAQITGTLGTNGFTGANLTAAQNYYAQNSSCTQVPESAENRLVANYRVKPVDALSLNAGYAFGDRKADVKSTFYNPIQGKNEGFENTGYLAFFQGSRRENLVKVGADWQAMDRLSLGISGKYRYDDYYDSTLGVDHGSVSSLNLDASYAYSENSTVAAFATWQWRQRSLDSQAGRTAIGVTASPGTWANHMTDDDVSVGLNGKQKGLMGGRFDLRENLSYTWTKVNYDTSVNYALASCSTTVTGTTNTNQACGSPGNITSKLIQFKVDGSYHIDKASSLLMGYLYQKLNSNDYFYNAYQYPNNFTTGLPTNQQSPNYNVNEVYVAYNYSFK